MKRHAFCGKVPSPPVFQIDSQNMSLIFCANLGILTQQNYLSYLTGVSNDSESYRKNSRSN